MAKASPKQWAVEREHGSIHALATYQVTTAVPGPRTVYRASFDFGFELPTPDSTVAVDPSAARLSGTFEPLDFSVPASSISSSLVVTLDGAREVRRVAFTSGQYNGQSAQLFRVDQQKVAPQETVSAGISGSQASAFGGFTDVKFALAVSDGSLAKSEIAAITVCGAATGVKLGLLDPDDPGSLEFFWPTPDQTGTSANAGAPFGKALQTYLAGKTGDLTPSARLVIQGDQPCTFVLTAFDTGATFALDGFAFPALVASDLDDAVALASRISAGGDPVSAFLRAAIGNASLLDGLNAVIAGAAIHDADRFAKVTLSPATQAALAAGDTARANRLLLQDAFPGAVAAPTEKRVLRFAAGSVGEAAVAVEIPEGATVRKATLTSEESLLADRLGANGSPPSADAMRAGVHIGGDGTTAVSVALAAAISATGIALPLVGLLAETEVSVELQDDFQGAPSGKTLAAGTVMLAVPGVQDRATVFFDPIVLPAGPAWLVLRASRGEAVWLAGAAAGNSLRVRRTPHGDSPTETALPNVAPVYELFTRSGEAALGAAASVASGSMPLAAHRDGQRVTYDLAPALRGGETIPLTFTSAVAGTITVYPPHVEYEL